MPDRRVIACVVRSDDRYLVCRRPFHKRHGGLWEFPGGKVQPGETDAEAARRELDEELGVHFVGMEPVAFEAADAGSEFVIVFVPVAIAGEPQLLEHVEMEWCTLEALHSKPLAPSDRAFVEFLSAPVASRRHGHE